MPASSVLYAASIPALAHLVASSALFQELTGAADETEALAFVHYPYAGDDLDASGERQAPLPRAIIDPIPKWEMVEQGVQSWHETGSAMLAFQALCSDAYTPVADTPAKYRARTLEWLDRVFTMIEEMRDNSTQDRAPPATVTHMRVRKFQLVDFGEEVNEDEVATGVMGAVFVVEW